MFFLHHGLSLLKNPKQALKGTTLPRESVVASLIMAAVQLHGPKNGWAEVKLVSHCHVKFDSAKNIAAEKACLLSGRHERHGFGSEIQNKLAVRQPSPLQMLGLWKTSAAPLINMKEPVENKKKTA
jgi:hypothetical protein